MSHRTIRLTSDVVLLPGIGGSGAGHWQTLWQDDNPDFARIAPASWEVPELADWMSALDRVTGDRAPLLVGHSLGCLLALEWCRQYPARTAGLFLVALPNSVAAIFPLQGLPFAAIDLLTPPPVPILMVASDNDPYCEVGRSREIAGGLGAGWVSLGAVGHINADSGLGNWDHGQDLLVAFDAGIGNRRRSAI